MTEPEPELAPANETQPDDIAVHPLLSLSDDLLTDWRLTAARAPTVTPFQSPEWLVNWATAYNELGRCFVLVVGEQDYRCFLSLMHNNAELRSLTYNATDYTGLVYDCAAPHVEPIARYLRLQARSLPVRLWNIRSTDPLFDYLRSENALSIVSTTQILGAALPVSGYRKVRGADIMSVSQFTRVKHRISKHSPRIDVHIGSQVPLLEVMSELHSRRWTLRGQPGNFGDRRRLAFIELLQASGRITFLTTQLWVGESLVAYRFGPLHEAVYYDWNTGFDPAWGRHSPGIYLLDETLARLPSLGINRIDFLRGAEGYKLAWATTGDLVYEAMVLA